MKAEKQVWRAASFLMLGILAAFGAARAQIGPGPFAAFPSQSATDGRFLGFGCAGLATFEQNVQVAMAAPAATTTFDLNIFDGDTGKPGVGLGHWDAGSRQLIYSLYADPLRTGSTAPANLIGTWTGNDPNPTSGPLWTASATFMPDNDWWAVTVTNPPIAQAPSGNYFYNLVIGLDGACGPAEALQSNIKIAASNPMSFRTPHFGLEGALLEVFNDGPIIYPGPFPPPGGFLSAPTTYDGTFEFFFTLPGGETELRLFDGDFDFGTDPFFPEGFPSGVPLVPCADEDDLNTTADYSGFPFSTTGASPEGVQGPGIPADDNDLDAFRRGEPDDPNRVGCVRYEVHDPNDNNVYFNDNPSGSFEWEQFVIATAASPYAADADYVVGGATLPGGVWKVKIIGLDLSNLNFWFADTCATRPERDPEPGESPDEVPRVPACSDESTYLLGDFVWADTANPGTLDPGEAGIPGVLMELVRPSDGAVIGTVKTGDTTSPNWPACVAKNTGTDTNGLYCFGMDGPGTYTVRVAASNFDPGGPLAGKSSTTGGDSQTRTLSTSNVLTYDFGYNPPKGSLGDRVWYDTDGDGVQDTGEPGLASTTVQLLNSGGTVIATAVTGANGTYTFTNLPAGSYSVRVVTSTLPAGGLAPTFDLDGTGSANIAAVTLAAGQNRTDVDFGYRGTRSVGDRVWKDLDGDGIQEAGEPGINGVTVRLFLGTTEVANTVTAGDGNYTFANLPEATYTVRVDSATLPAGVTQTYDLDGIATAHQATFALTASRTDVDFGYRPAATCTAGYYKDTFTTASFSNNDGTLAWTGSWIESDTAGTGVAVGNVTVGTPIAGYLILRDSPDTGTQPSAARQANLAGFATATLSFDFHVRTAVDPDDAVTVEVSKDGGATYTVLEVLDGYTGTATDSRSYNISAYISSNFRVRFRVSANYGASDELFKVDFVKIDGTCTPTPQTGSIGDRVWSDTDGDGVQDASETGLNGVTVQLLNSSGTVIATTTTASNGNYTFGSLAAGNYSVRVVSSTLPTGVTPTFDLDGTATAHIAAVTLTTGQTRTDVDFGYKPAAPCTTGYVKDNFTSASFSNNDGTLSWSGAWIESDTAGAGVSAGNVTVGIPYSGYLHLHDSPDTGTQPSAARQVNLSGFTSATLSFTFHTTSGVDSDDAVVVEMSNNGGSTYTVLETLTGITGATTATRSYNISSYIASNTRVRFRVTNAYGVNDEYFKVDTIRIDGSCTPTPPPTCTAGSYKDLFDTASFSNNNGSLSWTGAWIESDTAGAGVSSGNVTVGTPIAGYLILRDYPDTGTQPSAARQANLSGFTSATLSFDFHVRTAVDPDDAVTVEVSKDGGATYTVLEVLDGYTGTATDSRSYNVSAYISSNFRVRFRVSANYGAGDELFKVDWVKIDGTCAP